MQMTGISGYGQVNSSNGTNEEKKAQRKQKIAETKAEVKSEVGGFISEFQSGTGITAQGNKYEKATGGKIVGGVIGAVAGSLASEPIIGMGVGILSGHLFDHFFTNKTRAAQADAEAQKVDINA